MIGWLLANVFILAIVLIGAGGLWAVGASMWALGMPPDDYPGVLMIGCVTSIFVTYYLSKWLYGFVNKRM